MRRWKTVIVASLAALALSGCAGQLVSEADRTAQSNRVERDRDRLERDENFRCNAASIQSIREKYGTSAERQAAYEAVCGPFLIQPVPEPLSPEVVEALRLIESELKKQ